MGQVRSTSLRRLRRAVAPAVLMTVLLCMAGAANAAAVDAAGTDDPGSTPGVVEEEVGGSSFPNTIKQAAIIAVIPLTIGGLFYGARRLRGGPNKSERGSARGDVSPTPRATSHRTVAPPPGRTKSRSAMKQVDRLKRK